MNIHEYQAKALLHEFGVPISRGVAVLKASDSDAAAKQLPGPVWVVKSQIHAGGRGKGKFKEASAGDKGGVRIAKSVAEVNEFAKQMLGATLVTIQTGPEGQTVRQVLVEEGCDIARELYLGLTLDRATEDLLRKSLINASIYPAVLCGAGLLVVAFLMGYVVPRFSSIYEDLGSELPLASRITSLPSMVIESPSCTSAISPPAYVGSAARSATAITKNLLFPEARNPWNLERTPGGSSSGSAARSTQTGQAPSQGSPPGPARRGRRRSGRRPPGGPRRRRSRRRPCRRTADRRRQGPPRRSRKCR